MLWSRCTTDGPEALAAAARHDENDQTIEGGLGVSSWELGHGISGFGHKRHKRHKEGLQNEFFELDCWSPEIHHHTVTDACGPQITQNLRSMNG